MVFGDRNKKTNVGGMIVVLYFGIEFWSLVARIWGSMINSLERP